MIRSRTGRYAKSPFQFPQWIWVVVVGLGMLIVLGMNAGWALAAPTESHTPLATDYTEPTPSAPSVTPSPTAMPVRQQEPVAGSVVVPPQPVDSNPVIEYIKSKDWPVEDALRIAKCESNYRPDAIGDVNLPDGGPVSVGVFQIRAFANRPSVSELMDYVVNVDWAYGMWKSQGFHPWTCR